jgi:hypothetical protein
MDLSSDADPAPGDSPWRLPSGTSGPKIEMNFRLSLKLLRQRGLIRKKQTACGIFWEPVGT